MNRYSKKFIVVTVIVVVSLGIILGVLNGIFEWSLKSN